MGSQVSGAEALNISPDLAVFPQVCILPSASTATLARGKGGKTRHQLTTPNPETCVRDACPFTAEHLQPLLASSKRDEFLGGLGQRLSCESLSGPMLGVSLGPVTQERKDSEGEPCLGRCPSVVQGPFLVFYKRGALQTRSFGSTRCLVCPVSSCCTQISQLIAGVASRPAFSGAFPQHICRARL